MTCQMHPCALEMAGQLVPERGVGVHGGVRGCKIYGVPSGKEHTLLSWLPLSAVHPAKRFACVPVNQGPGSSSGSHISALGRWCLRDSTAPSRAREAPLSGTLQEGACKEGPCVVWWGLHPGASASDSGDPCLHSGRERQAMPEPVSQLPALAAELQRSARTETGSRDPNFHTVHELQRGSMLAELLPEPEVTGKGLSPHALSLASSRFG